MSKLIVLDPGHGGQDPGAVFGPRREKDDALLLAQAVAQQLIKAGQTVLMTRNSDQFLSLSQRTTLANNSGGALFVSLHRNSFTNQSANGMEIWVYTTATAADTALAAQVLEELVQVGAQQNRGVKKGNYHVLRETAMPAMLIELGFISNPEDNRLLDTHFHRYAAAIARGICLGLGETPPQPAKPSGPVYRVQVGAFSKKANAQAFLEQIHRMGLQAFLVGEAMPGKE